MNKQWTEYSSPLPYCPVCFGEDISNEDGPDDYNRLPVTCLECGNQWYEPNDESKSSEWEVSCPTCGDFVQIQKSDPVCCPKCQDPNIETKNVQ